MLVRSIRPFKDYTGTREIGAGRLFIVYAIEKFRNEQYYYVLPVDVNFEDDESDPLFFDVENFEIVQDRTQGSWVTKQMHVPRGETQYTSFPEWFENDFYIRAHDWDLQGDDYKIVKKYKQKYEELYKDYIPK